MALRDLPYIPLDVNDIMTDEKLNECSPATHGIYIKGLMCLMHKSEEYGKILLKQNVKPGSNFCLAFALQLVKHLPYTVEQIEAAISELIKERVCYFENGYLCQKRMIRDNEISNIRSVVGKRGGEKSAFAKAKRQAKGSAKVQPPVEKDEFTQEYNIYNNNSLIEELYNNVIIYFDEDCLPKTEKQKKDWLDVLDKLNRVDGYSPEHIQNIIKRTRMDDFWKTNFLSVLKLRKKNKEGIMYFTVFEKKMNYETTGRNNKQGASTEQLTKIVYDTFEAGKQ